MKRIIFLTLVSLFVFSNCLLFGGDYRFGKSLKISERDTINSDLFISAQFVNIYGNVNGDIWSVGQNITIRNITNNGIFAAAQNIDIESSIKGGALLLGASVKFKGDINGGLKSAAGIIIIDGYISRDLIIAGSQVYIEKETVIGGDLILLGCGEVTINGVIKGNLSGRAERLFLGGKVMKNADLKIEKELELMKSCLVGGNFYYESPLEFKIDKELVKGSISYKKEILDKPYFSRFMNMFMLYSMIAAIIFAIILLPFTKKKLPTLFQKLDTCNWSTLGWGFLLLIVIPIAILILFGLIITIPVAILLKLLLLMAFYVGKIFAGIYIGNKILYLINKKEPNLYLSALVGLIILYAIFLLPTIGILVYIIAAAYGIGVFSRFFIGLFAGEK